MRDLKNKLTSGKNTKNIKSRRGKSFGYQVLGFGGAPKIPDPYAISFLVVAGGGGGGWFGSTTLLKVMPTQWIMNDDYTRAPVVVEDDVTNVLGIKAPATSTELYAFMAIPTGYKATHVQVYTSSNKINGVEVLRFSHVSGATAARGTGDFNTSIDITDISSAVATNICIKLLPASVTTIIYGADITIATI